jgi:hypothetical protein
MVRHALLHSTGIEIEIKETMMMTEGKMMKREAVMMRRVLRKKSVADGAPGRNLVAGIAPHCSTPK